MTNKWLSSSRFVILSVTILAGWSVSAGQEKKVPRFFMVAGKFVMDEEGALKKGEHLCILTDSGFVAATVNGWDRFEDTIGGEYRFPFLSVETRPLSGGLCPAFRGHCNGDSDSAQITAGRRGILPVGLAKILAPKAAAAFSKAMTELDEHGAFSKWDEAFLQRKHKPWQEWRVRLYKLKNCAIADVWIDFIDKVKFGTKDPLFDYDSSVDENHVQVGAVHYIVWLAKTWHILVEEAGGVREVRDRYHSQGSYFSGYRIISVTDLDGNGKPEIQVPWGYYEGGGVTLYELRGSELKEVAGFGCGL